VREGYDDESGRTVQMVTGITSLCRVAAGVAVFVRPEALPRALGVDRGSARRATFITRMFGAREIGLGLGTLYALNRGKDVAPWILAQAVGDAGDAIALAAAARRRQVRPVRGALLALGAAGAAISAVMAVRDLRR
jgi:hypothetical protein